MAQMDPRFQVGKHLTLVEDRHLPYIANIPRHIVPAYAAWSELCQEGRDLVDAGILKADLLDRVEAVEHFLNNSLRLTVSVGARGREDLTRAIASLDDRTPHRDAGKAVFDAERAPRVIEAPRVRRGGLKP